MASGLTHSVWMEDNSGLSQGRLGRDVVCDVCVIGGGIAGLTTAYLLAEEGCSVVLLEKDLLASGQTERTTSTLLLLWFVSETYSLLRQLCRQNNRI